MYYDGPGKVFDYRYGPIFAVAISPLAMLPTELGSFCFIWVSVAIFYLVVRN